MTTGKTHHKFGPSIRKSKANQAQSHDPFATILVSEVAERDRQENGWDAVNKGLPPQECGELLLNWGYFAYLFGNSAVGLNERGIGLGKVFRAYHRLVKAHPWRQEHGFADISENGDA